ncbi:hypothetical protein XELAEV_18037222mg [Xenopus laevis]|uniref:Uncharacterized protein n=1 Tax=Xenopus laevis TaxID=8355 RepID=A0A974CBR7_XENLA|nr:hypothetical protein XELAEV_18037222mg [Xenopus laevis]
MPSVALVTGNPPAAVTPPSATSSACEPRIPPPPCYNGDPQACRGFVTQCLIQLEYQPSQYSSERAKVVPIPSLLLKPLR